MQHTIYTFWVGDIPPLAAKCIESMRRLNPGWEVQVLDETHGAAHRCGEDGLGKQHCADVVRAEVLAQHGGV